ncbi:unnamed protein product, partial [Mesorhabditis spiculigera]
MDTAIISKFEIVDTSTSWLSATYALVKHTSGLLIHTWAMHADYRAYGPYAACNRMVRNLSVILQGEEAPYGDATHSRIFDVKGLLNTAVMQASLKKTEKEAIIVAGDFNSPSHLDWTNETKSQHCGWVVEWPVTKLMEDAEFLDSFREVFSNPATRPGKTWSPITKGSSEWDYALREPQDRIDFIFYQGPIQANNSARYAGSEPISRQPNCENNDWPSDHYAVWTDFVIVEK